MRREKAEIESQAAVWAELMSRPVQDSRAAAEFDRWIEADPRHVESYARMAALWQSGELTTALAASAAGGSGASNDDDRDWRGVEWARDGGRAGGLRGAILRGVPALPRPAAALAASIAALLLAVPQAPGMLSHEQVYAAPRGSGRAVELADGSRLHLSGGSRLSVRITPWGRKVTIEEGEAFFDVAHERFRPFSVDTGAASVTVLGTAFDIDMMASGAREVRVYRGLVSVEAGGSQWRLPAGTGLNLSGSRAQRFDDVRGRQPDWIDGWFDARDTSLARLIERLNRTAGRPVVLADPSLGALRVTGRFRMGQPQELLETLAAIHDLSWEDDGARYVLSK